MRVEIYSKEDCGYCAMAKTLLTSKHIPFTEQVLGIDFTREQLLANYSLARTFPVIVVDGFYIGGYTNLVEHIEKNGVVQLLVEEPPVVVAEVPTSAELDVIAAAATVVVEPAVLDLAVEEVVIQPTPAKPSRKYSR